MTGKTIKSAFESEQTRDGPDGYWYPRELWELAKELPDAQRRKLCDAALSLFFEGEVPDNLPPKVKLALSGWDERILFARKKSDERRKEKKGNATSSNAVIDSLMTSCEKVDKNPPKFSEENSMDSSALSAETVNSLGSGFGQMEWESKEEPYTFSSSSTTTSEISAALFKGGPCNELAHDAGHPTYDEVYKYIKAIGCIEVEPKKFFDYYEKRGWHDKNGNAIDDWRGKVRQWQKTEGYISSDSETELSRGDTSSFDWFMDHYTDDGFSSEDMADDWS